MQEIVEKRERCLETRTLEAFAGMELDVEAAVEAADHISRCVPCRRRLSGIAVGLARKRRLDRWRSLAALFAPRRECLAAADGQTADQQLRDTASRSGFIHFIASAVGEDEPGFWHVKLALPTVVTAESRLRMQVLDGKGILIPVGTLTFCGVDLEVKDGRASMPVSVFRERIKDPENAVILFRGEDGNAQAGMLAFAYEMRR